MAISEDDFKRLATEEQDRLIHYLRKLCHGDLHRAQDIAQEALIRTWKRIDSIIPPGKSYLYRVAKTCWIDDWRQSENKPLNYLVTNLGEHERRAPSPETQYVLREEVDQILSALSEPQRQLVEMRMRGDHLSEIAARLGIPIGTVKSRLDAVRSEIRTNTPAQPIGIRDRIMEIARRAEYVSGPIASRRLNISVENAAYHLKLLERQGLLIRVKRTDRIKIKEKSRVQWMLARTG